MTSAVELLVKSDFGDPLCEGYVKVMYSSSSKKVTVAKEDTVSLPNEVYPTDFTISKEDAYAFIKSLGAPEDRKKKKGVYGAVGTDFAAYVEEDKYGRFVLVAVLLIPFKEINRIRRSDLTL